MWKKIREFIFIQSDIPSVQEDFERAEEASGALLMDDPGIAVVDQMPPRYEEAQHTVNRALAMYCEICDKSFAHTGLAKNHKRLAHKTI